MHTSTISDERELLQRTAQGDEKAFARLFYAYHNKLGAYIFRLTDSREVTEEIVQDVFMRIWTRKEVLASVERFGAYLYVLSRNHTLNHLRRLAKERVRNLEAVKSIRESQEVVVTAEPAPDYYFLLDRAVEELPLQQQKAYLLSRRERLKYDEIAQQMNISRETVKKHLQSATRFITSYVRARADLWLLILFMASRL